MRQAGRRHGIVVVVWVVAAVCGGRPAAAQDGACALLTLADVRRAFPGAAAGQPDRSLARQGIDRCTWTHPNGRVLVISGAAGESPRDEALSWMEGLVDPMRADAVRQIRIESIAGIGGGAVAIVEPRDAARGILQDAALIVVRGHTAHATVMAGPLARQDRAEALRVLTALGTALAPRLP
ncbi:MAG: hypothetical protein R2745_05765 [Vicinamibacterales bacterium]